MTEDHIKEVMRLAELWATYAWKACSYGADETEKSKAGRAALEAYLRTIEPAQSVNAELLEALKDARHCIGIDRDTLVDCHTNPCTGYLDPDGALAKAEYDDVIDAADAAIARAESAIEGSPKPVTFPAMKAAFRTTRVEAGEFIMAFKFRDIEDMDRADDEWRAAMAIETPAKVSPCAGHAVQQEAGYEND